MKYLKQGQPNRTSIVLKDQVNIQLFDTIDFIYQYDLHFDLNTLNST